jgi:MoaA/NifB/PqqE/SkfB family radical SAM enzyme
MRYPVTKFPIKNSLKALVRNFILRNPVPILFSLSVTHRCNARCPFCGFWKSKPTEEMTAEEIEKVMADAYDLGCLTVVLTGGEPLLRKDLPKILRYAKEAGLSTYLLTNGYLLPNSISHIHENLDLVNVSIDFPDSRHDRTRGLKGLLERATEGINLAAEYGVSTNINSIITGAHCLKDIEDLLAIAERLNSGVSFAPMVELPESYYSKAFIGVMSGESEKIRLNDWDNIRTIAERLLYHKRHRYRKIMQNTEAYLELIRDQGDFACYPFSLQVGVSPTGDVGALCGLGLHDCYCLGNALNQDLKEIWYSGRAEWLREKFKECRLAREVGCYMLCVAELSLLYVKPSILLDYAKRLV